MNQKSLNNFIASLSLSLVTTLNYAGEMGPKTSSSYFFLGIDGGYSVSSDTTYFQLK